MKRTVLSLLLGMAFVALTAAGASAQTPAEKGKAVFDAQHCSLCHSVAGKGNVKGALDGMGSKLTAAQIKEWLTEPAEQAKKANADRKPPMKSFKTLPPADLDALVAYVLKPEEVVMRGRRDFVDWLLGSWLVGVFGSVLYPITRYLVPPDVTEAAPPSVVAGKAADIAPNTGKIVPFGTSPVILVRTSGGEFRAFSATCTHLSCTVQYRTDLEHIWCACHNGHYDLTGRNIDGPPPRPLDRYDVALRGDDVVIVRRT